MDQLSKRALAAEAESAEALRALAAEHGISLTGEEARAYFAKLHPPVGELADDELEAVSGGGCGSAGYTAPTPKQVHFVGDEIPMEEIPRNIVYKLFHADCRFCRSFQVTEAHLGKTEWTYRLQCTSCGASMGFYTTRQLAGHE